ncbi:MAG: cytochrome c [Candidatus Eremiobacteraeota bacterium]|nr:cytochrome c [Candidatus Eremiobacteraeota bacterium]
MRRHIGFASLALTIALAWSAVPQLGAASAVPVTREPHMEMSVHMPAAAGDAARADAVLAGARAVMAQYPTPADAERAGFKKFLPGVPLPVEHYTSGTFALEAWFGRFDAKHPTSLIFRRNPQGMTLVGVMYTASNAAGEEQLNERVPLSYGTWHRHINFCAPPDVGSAAARTDARGAAAPNARFGFAGSISTAAACETAGGTFRPLVFGWMVHVWPNERDPAKIWAVDADGDAHHMHGGTAAGMVGQRAYGNTLPIALDKLPSLKVASGDERRGAIVFAENCQECHGVGARNGPDAPPLAGMGLSAGQVAYMVRKPKAIDPASEMPLLSLDDTQLADVAAFVAGLK